MVSIFLWLLEVSPPVNIPSFITTILLYMDNLFLTDDEKLIVDSKRKFPVELDMKDLGTMNYFLSLEVW